MKIENIYKNETEKIEIEFICFRIGEVGVSRGRMTRLQRTWQEELCENEKSEFYPLSTNESLHEFNKILSYSSI